ncbi:MAG: hypothetical protein R6X33_06570, partial [Candidatus Brocadiia bacterium]
NVGPQWYALARLAHAGYGCYKLVGFLSKFVGKVRHSWLETNIKKKISIFFSVVVFGLFFLSVHKIHLPQ